MLRIFLKAILCIGLFWSIGRFCSKQTDGLQITRISSNLPFNPAWETAPLSKEEFARIEEVLKQPFSYLDSGGQAYAFESADRKTVLKLFKHHHMRPFFKLGREKLERIFRSNLIAYTEFKEETGLLYLQLNKSQLFSEPLVIIDKLGIAHRLNPNALTFALQKKASLVCPTLRTLVQEGKIEEAKDHLNSLLSLALKRSSLGIADRDAALRRNFGFVEGKAIEIDLGSFLKDETLKEARVSQETLIEESLKLVQWVGEHTPQLFPYLQDRLKEFGADKRPSLSPDLKPILDQKFFYEGKVRSWEIYRSADKKYLLKLCKFPQGPEACHLRQENTALFLHLHKTSSGMPSVILHNRLGFSRILDLNKKRFILEKIDSDQ